MGFYDHTEPLPTHWVDVREALPPIGVEVTVCKKDGTVTALCRYASQSESIRWAWDNSYPGNGENIHLPEAVTHWRAFPAGPNSAEYCPHCGAYVLDVLYDPTYYTATNGGRMPNTPDGPGESWVEGVQECPECGGTWELDG